MWLRGAALLLAVVAAASAGEEQAVQDVDFEDFEGRTFETMYNWWDEMSNDFWSWLGYDEDYYYDDYGNGFGPEVNYGIPQVGFVPASAGGLESSYVSYNPHEITHNHLEREDDYDEDEEFSISGMLFDMAVIGVPLALLFSAIPTGVVTLALRRRSLDDNALDEIEPEQLPLLRAIEESSFLALLNRQCQEKLFCELTLIGEKDNASYMQKAMYYTAMLTPDFVARRVGLQKLFRTARAGECFNLSCHATDGPALPKTLQAPTNEVSVEAQ